ncbi:hypothetical protein ABGB18_42500 [Nonomuraea sp. B12E4]|uniref:hypothetical protein n=1 Tax=Nonomuraea sp. B12E4 TaxID=3153564 RepID=UPI00325D3668
MPTFDEVTGFVTDKPIATAVIAVLSLAGLVLAFLVVRVAWRALSWLFKRYVAERPVEDVLTIVAASIATGASAQGMWLFTGDVLKLPVVLRVLLFAFIEVAVVTSAVRARRNMRENYSAGVDGIAVWALTLLTAVLSSMHPSSIPEKVFRLAAPMVAAWLWERGMAIERRRIRGTSGINWRLTPERVFVRLGLAEATDRTAGDVDRQRRLARVSLAVLDVDDQQGGKPKKQRKALTAFRARIAQAVEHAGLATDPEAQQAVLAQIDTLRSAEALVNRRQIARWADPVTSEQRANALAAIEEAQRFDTAEAKQRALDKAAATLMALTERVTYDVTSRRVNGEVNNKVNGHPVPAPREVEKLTLPVTSHVTPELTVERVNPVLNFDVTNPASFAIETALSADPYVTSGLSGQLTAAALNFEVNEDPEDVSKTQVMEDYWRSEVAQDRYPTVKELAAHAGVDPSHASRKRKDWVADLPWWKRRKADPKRTPKSIEPATSTPTGDQS